MFEQAQSFFLSMYYTWTCHACDRANVATDHPARCVCGHFHCIRCENTIR